MQVGSKILDLDHDATKEQIADAVILMLIRHRFAEAGTTTLDSPALQDRTVVKLDGSSFCSALQLIKTVAEIKLSYTGDGEVEVVIKQKEPRTVQTCACTLCATPCDVEVEGHGICNPCRQGNHK